MDFSLLLAGFEWISLLCLVAGLALVVLEMFLPGFGAPGITGIILLIIGVVTTAKTPLQAMIMIIIILAILGVAFTLVLLSAQKGHLSKHLVLNESLDDGESFSAVDDLSYFVGSEGRTLTVLRPSGTADFNGVKLDVVSDGEYIPKNAAVIITKIEGNRIVVNQKHGA